MQMTSNICGLFYNKIAGRCRCPWHNSTVLYCIRFHCFNPVSLYPSWVGHIYFRAFLSRITWILHWWCFCTSTGPVRPWSGAVPLQWGQHDGVQAAQHRQPSGGLGGGAVGHGATAGSLQSWDWNDGGDDDSELNFTFLLSLLMLKSNLQVGDPRQWISKEEHVEM